MSDKPILLIRLGDKEKGWIPDKSYEDVSMKQAEASGLTDKFNTILFHYGIDVQLLETKMKLEDYGLKIVDEEKFENFIKSSE